MSKGLEALKCLITDLVKFPDNSLAYAMQKDEVDTIEKELKALEIIKKKQVNIISLLSSIEWYNPSHYNDSVGCPIGCELTQKEYNLLKEVLNA